MKSEEIRVCMVEGILGLSGTMYFVGIVEIVVYLFEVFERVWVKCVVFCFGVVYFCVCCFRFLDEFFECCDWVCVYVILGFCTNLCDQVFCFDFYLSVY